jgi:biopolymer transport protein ExbD
MIVKITGRMCCKFLVLGSLAALLFVGLPAFAHPFSSLPQQGQQSAQPSAVSGKVVSIADDKKSFSLDVTNNGNANTMQFVLDQNTQVTGHVHVGSDATVQYQTAQDGKLLALNVAPKSQ